MFHHGRGARPFKELYIHPIFSYLPHELEGEGEEDGIGGGGEGGGEGLVARTGVGGRRGQVEREEER